MRKTLKQYNTRVISLIMFYGKRKLLTFKMLGVIVYCLIEKYICVDYLSLQREPKLSSSHKKFEDTLFDELSVIGIPEILLKIVSCYSFVQEDNSTIMLTYRSKLV